MNTIILESISDLNNDIAEIMSEYIYESTILEADTEPATDDKKGGKVKEIWNKFVTAMKRILDKLVTFVKGLGKKIKDATKLAKIFDYEIVISSFEQKVTNIENIVAKDGKLDAIDFSPLAKYSVEEKTVPAKKAIEIYTDYTQRTKKLLDRYSKIMDKVSPQFITENANQISMFTSVYRNLVETIQKEFAKLQTELGKEVKVEEE